MSGLRKERVRLNHVKHVHTTRDTLCKIQTDRLLGEGVCFHKQVNANLVSKNELCDWIDFNFYSSLSHF